MGRIAALTFTFSAIMILMAHAVIPHHHHEHGKSTADPGHQHEIPNHGHERHGEPTDRAFILDEEIVLRLTQGKSFGDLSEQQYNHSLKIQSFGLVSLHESVVYLPVLNSDASIPLIASSYICFSASSCGLRAPPSI